MHAVRSRILSLLLTLVVGLGLATSAFAHRLPTASEMQLQALQVLGLTSAAICGDAGHGPGQVPCADDTCGLCGTPAAPALAAFGPLAAPAPRLVLSLGWGQDTARTQGASWLGPKAQAPPGRA